MENNTLQGRRPLDKLSKRPDRTKVEGKESKIIEIISHFNEVSGKRITMTGKISRGVISRLLYSGYSVDDMKSVIDRKTAEWQSDPCMKKYIRLETMLGYKFKDYLEIKEHQYSHPAEDASEYKKKYAEYLKSPHWNQRKKEVKISRKICEKCGSRHNLAVHHLSYKNIGNEPDDDLMLLCDDCHHKEHFPE